MLKKRILTGAAQNGQEQHPFQRKLSQPLEFFTLRQVARLLSVNPQVLRKWVVEEGYLNVDDHVCRAMLFSPATVRSFFREEGRICFPRAFAESLTPEQLAVEREKVIDRIFQEGIFSVNKLFNQYPLTRIIKSASGSPPDAAYMHGAVCLALRNEGMLFLNISPHGKRVHNGYRLFESDFLAWKAEREVPPPPKVRKQTVKDFMESHKYGPLRSCGELKELLDCRTQQRASQIAYQLLTRQLKFKEHGNDIPENLRLIERISSGEKKQKRLLIPDPLFELLKKDGLENVRNLFSLQGASRGRPMWQPPADLVDIVAVRLDSGQSVQTVARELGLTKGRMRSVLEKTGRADLANGSLGKTEKKTARRLSSTTKEVAELLNSGNSESEAALALGLTIKQLFEAIDDAWEYRLMDGERPTGPNNMTILVCEDRKEPGARTFRTVMGTVPFLNSQAEVPAGASSAKSVADTYIYQRWSEIGRLLKIYGSFEQIPSDLREDFRPESEKYEKTETYFFTIPTYPRLMEWWLENELVSLPHV